MMTKLTTLAIAGALVTGLTAAGSAMAHQSGGPQGSTMGQGGMMKMMEQMGEMSENCNKMMQKMTKDYDARKPDDPSPNQGATR